MYLNLVSQIMSIHRIFQCLFIVFLYPSLGSTHRDVKLLPQPSGPYSVAINTMELIDINRLDPFAPTKTLRKIMVSAIYPLQDNSSSDRYPYMPPLTAAFEDNAVLDSIYKIPNGSYESLFLQVGCNANPREEAPLVLFSPAQGNSRLDYSLLISNVASHGFTVVMLDHPYDADIVEFPDGSYIIALPVNESATLAQTEVAAIAAIAVRVGDISFVLDQLANETVVRKLIPGRDRALNTSSVAMFGHSLGGAATASAMVNETRIKGGINMDSAIFGSVLEEGLDRPFVLFGHTNNTRFYDGEDPGDQYTASTWTQLWSVLTGWKLELELAGSFHYTFSDFQSQIQTLGVNLNATELVTILSGGDEFLELNAEVEVASLLKADRAREIVVQYVVAFFEFVLKGKKELLLSGESPQYPEVTFI